MSSDHEYNTHHIPIFVAGVRAGDLSSWLFCLGGGRVWHLHGFRYLGYRGSHPTLLLQLGPVTRRPLCEGDLQLNGRARRSVLAIISEAYVLPNKFQESIKKDSIISNAKCVAIVHD